MHQSVRLSIPFSNLIKAHGTYSTWLTRGSMRHGQCTFRLDNKEDWHTCWLCFEGQIGVATSWCVCWSRSESRWYWRTSSVSVERLNGQPPSTGTASDLATSTRYRPTCCRQRSLRACTRQPSGWTTADRLFIAARPTTLSAPTSTTVIVPAAFRQAYCKKKYNKNHSHMQPFLE